MVEKCVETWLKIIQKQNMPSNFQPYLKDRVYHPIIIKKVSGVFLAIITIEPSFN